MQVGDESFSSFQPAEIPVAGDQDDLIGPVYATFDVLRSYLPFPVGGWITQRIDRSATAVDDPALASYAVTVATVDPVTNHSIATPFWEFMTSTGTIYENGAYHEAQLFADPLYATGRPIAEPYWATVKVGGSYRDVLLQCFERRCLTYTPDNPDGWKVEAGNVGRHYLAWRSAQPEVDHDSVIVYRTLVSTGDGNRNQEIFSVRADGTAERNLSNNSDSDFVPELSPSGRYIAYLHAPFQKPHELWLMNADGSNQRPHPGMEYMRSVGLDPYIGGGFAWSPDETYLAVSSFGHGDNYNIFLLANDGSGAQQVTHFSNNQHVTEIDWSPDGTSLVFATVSFTDIGTGPPTLYTIGVDGTGLRQLSTNTSRCDQPDWSPDGSKIACSWGQIIVMNSDGSDWHIITDMPQGAWSPSWSLDGASIAFEAMDGFGGIASGVAVVASTGGTVSWIAEPGTGSNHPSWGPAIP
ncbi:MAG TPA: hypothetical protein VFV93_08290 [Thermomicrobiales bacterium]|nr:hypothetical protein [Thermomicrobiales bacterium]